MTGDEWANQRKCIRSHTDISSNNGTKMLLRTDRQTCVYESVNKASISQSFTCNPGQQYKHSWEDAKLVILLTCACLQPRLRVRYVKLAASSQAICRTPHTQHHSVDITSLFTGSITDIHWAESLFQFNPLLQCAVLCCSVSGSLSSLAAAGLPLGGRATGLGVVCEP